MNAKTAIPPPIYTARSTPSPWPTGIQWLWFLFWVVVIEIVDAAGDIARGNLHPANVAAAIRHAQDVVAFEKAHGFFWEPIWQIYFHHVHHILGITLTWSGIVDLSNNIYAWLHIAVPLLVGAWVFARHRLWFPLFRNTLLITTALAAIFYHLYPVAPPRLTPNVTFNHHLYRFADTMKHSLGGPQVNGHTLGDNPYAAMPSVHLSWALIVTATVVLLSPVLLMRLLILLYPGIILCAVVITSNHYIMDGIGAIPFVIAGFLLALGIDVLRRSEITGELSPIPLRPARGMMRRSRGPG